MSVWRTLLGGAAGFALGGPIGALIGGIAGHAMDRIRGEDASPVDEEAATRKIAFTIGVIALSAKMAKADGVVTRDEIAAFRDRFEIPTEEVRNFGQFWDKARQDVAGYDAYARQVAKLFNPRSPVLEELLGNLFYIAKADGVVDETELAYLREVAGIFGFDGLAFDRLHTVYGGGKDDPYSVIGIEPGASDDAVKTAYRDLVRANHPDRLMAQGVPEEMMAAATEKMAVINAAYDKITKQRGLN
jgi:DnaJ like chaperone protein